LVGLVGLVGLIGLIGLVGSVLLLHPIGLAGPFVSLAVHPRPHNLNIANIQTSPNKKVDNILFSFILLFVRGCATPTK
jgi:hypothetical protein